MKRCVAFDLGATSGRVMVAEVGADVLRARGGAPLPQRRGAHDDGSLRWDIERIHRELLVGLRAAAARGPVDGIGIDSWAIDYGLLDADGRLLGAPYSHRDGRTDGVREKVVGRARRVELYAVTGIQQLPFNTLYQLVAAQDSARLADAATLLLLPDLLAYWLTGDRGRRAHQRLDHAVLRRHHARVGAAAARAARPAHRPAAAAASSPATVDRRRCCPRSRAEVGLPDGTPVIAVGSHDTASAVVGVPIGEPPSAYISSGTWSLVGLELAAPVLTEAARAADFTNEGGVDGTVRFLQERDGPLGALGVRARRGARRRPARRCWPRPPTVPALGQRGRRRRPEPAAAWRHARPARARCAEAAGEPVPVDGGRDGPAACWTAWRWPTGARVRDRV